MKKIILCILALLFLQISVQAQQKELIDKVISTVGDEYILRSDVEEGYAVAKDRAGDNLPPNYRCMVLDQLMTGKLLVNQAKIDSLYPKDEEVETQLTARIEQILGYMGGSREQFISYYSKTPEEVKEEMRDDMRDQLMSEKMRSKILSEVTITPSEVKSFFAKIPKDSLPYFNQEVEIAEIVYKAKANDAEKAKAKAMLEDLRYRILEKKEDFAALAKKYSQDPGSGREGGDLGWAKRGKFVPEFEAEAYKLEENGMSPVFESDFGFHILQLLQRRGNSIHTRHILIKPQVTSYDMEKAKILMDSVRREISRDSLRFSDAVKQFSDKNSQSYHNDGRITNQQSGTNAFETRDLDPQIYFAIDTMKAINSITQPIELATAAGEKGYRLIKLLSRTTPHKADLRLDYNKIQQAALEQKKTTALISWIAEKVQNTFVRIDKIYEGCPTLDKWKNSKKMPKSNQ